MDMVSVTFIRVPFQPRVNFLARLPDQSPNHKPDRRPDRRNQRDRADIRVAA